MKISRSNYESWFLDYLEGDLDASFADEFESFLALNPDLAEELDRCDPIRLAPDSGIQYIEKEQLKKMADRGIEFEEFAVAYYEGDLPIAEQKNFEAIVAENAIKATEATKFAKLKLIADKKIGYTNKAGLKRKDNIIPYWLKVASVAAVLILSSLLFKTQTGVKKHFDNQIAGIENPIVRNESGTLAKKEEKTTAVRPALMRYPKKNTVEVRPDRMKVQEAVKSDKKAEKASNPRPPKPELLKPKGISVGQSYKIELAMMTLKDPDKISAEVELSELLKVHLAAMRRSDDREFLSTDYLRLSGLQLFAKLSGKRLTARKDHDGTIKSVSFHSHLLAFSIPVNR